MIRTLRTVFVVLFAVSAIANAQSAGSHFEVVGTTIAETQKAIREGRTTCRAVVTGYLARIRAYDQTPIHGLRLNSIVTLQPERTC